MLAGPMSPTPAPADPPSDDPAAVVSSRVLAACRDDVYRAFADPAVLARWWGPAGFANEFRAFDFRPGGAWRFVMRGPDGTAYELDKRFVAIDPGERIVLRHLDPAHGFEMTMTFADAPPAGTRLTWLMRFDDPAEADRVRPHVLAANEQNFDRLAAELAAAPTAPAAGPTVGRSASRKQGVPDQGE